MSAQLYRFLEEGETIEAGDEYLDDLRCEWQPTSALGAWTPLGPGEVGHVRRPITAPDGLADAVDAVTWHMEAGRRIASCQRDGTDLVPGADITDRIVTLLHAARTWL